MSSFLCIWVHFRYKNDKEILAMTNLVAAYQRNDIMEFESILKVLRLMRVVMPMDIVTLHVL